MGKGNERDGSDDGDRWALSFEVLDGHALVFGPGLDRVLEEGEDEDDGE
jgi:hypothetical protein